ENPLYLPKNGTIYLSPSVGLMYKEANDNLAMRAKNHVGEKEFPVGRFHLDAGYGLTDRLTIRLMLGWTQNDEINRVGMHNGRLGLNYRVFDDTIKGGWVWDVYSDLYLSGVSKMKAKLVQSPNTAMVLDGTYPLSFDYDNYSHGRNGVWVGIRLGKTWNKSTYVAFAEVLRTFGNDNSDIRISESAKAVVAGMVNSMSPNTGELYIQGLPKSFSVDTKSTWENTFGIKGHYEIDNKLSMSAGFTYKHRATNSIGAVNMNVAATAPLTIEQTEAITGGVAARFLGSLYDGWDEYILAMSVSRRLTDSVQFSLYGEYTFDRSEVKSQNGTNVKAEVGCRLYLRF
ncbi:MAG: hypothetical protein FWG02_11095, partial [Holophagaceae bacterium]|nr:hypothetical protein [Holophagaceae bacterium]